MQPTRGEDPDYQVISTGMRYKHGRNPEKCGDSYVCQEVEAKCDECYEFDMEGDVVCSNQVYSFDRH